MPKGIIPWILLLVAVLAAFFVGMSIWNSLQDTREKLREQENIVRELNRKDSLMNVFVDSLDTVMAGLREREEQLAQERDALNQQLAQLQQRFRRTMARLDTLWSAGSVIAELDEAFPEWRGQIREATRADGVHALIAPRFFGARVAEVKAERDNGRKEIALKDSTIANFEQTLVIKEEQVRTMTLKADTLEAGYERWKGAYGELDVKYRDLLRKKWFSVKLVPGHLVSAGAGFAAGYVVREVTK